MSNKPQLRSWSHIQPELNLHRKIPNVRVAFRIYLQPGFRMSFLTYQFVQHALGSPSACSSCFLLQAYCRSIVRLVENLTAIYSRIFHARSATRCPRFNSVPRGTKIEVARSSKWKEYTTQPKPESIKLHLWINNMNEVNIESCLTKSILPQYYCWEADSGQQSRTTCFSDTATTVVAMITVAGTFLRRHTRINALDLPSMRSPQISSSSHQLMQ